MKKYKDISQYKIGENATYNHITGSLSYGDSCIECVFHTRPNDFCFSSNCISWLRESDGRGKNTVFK